MTEGTEESSATALAQAIARLSAAPQRLDLLDQAAGIAQQSGDAKRAADLYLDFIGQHASHAGAQFNCGYYCRAAGYYQQAIDHYQQALTLTIEQPEEVHTNIGVIYNEGLLDNRRAAAAFEQALAIAPHYLPALYNLANCYEQDGDKERAAAYFQKVIQQAPQFAMAYVRLADVQRASAPDEPLIKQLDGFLKQSQRPLTERIDMAFALGKLNNDCGDYQAAWRYYQQGNAWNASLMPAWNEAKQRETLELVRAQFSELLSTNTSAKKPQPVFVCGMFRSGSTLLEQMLGGHSAITSGGELEFFARRWQRWRREGLQASLDNFSAAQAATLGEDYLAFVRERLGDVEVFTDKRPDNIWLIGLIKRALPQAKFIVTRREPLDNALSVYFTRLGKAMPYANRFADILAYMQIERELLDHWQQLLGDDLQVVDYDQLVIEPQQQLAPVLKQLGLSWQPQCLDFHQRDNSVRTASVWQVRQPLYQSSSGRWRNYQQFLAEFTE